MKAFECLKSALVSPPVLVMPDFSKLFVVEADASGFRLGAVLMQDIRPLAFFRQLLGPQAQHKQI